MAKRLIITADDFGLTKEVNRNIIECYKNGAITDISLLAVGDAFSDAVMLAKENNIKRIGVHLALTGCFKEKNFPKTYGLFLLKYFMNPIKNNEVYTELKNQILKVKNAGFTITHVDSHHHMHMLPGILRIVIKLMKEEGMDNVRFPLEKINIFKNIANPPAIFRNSLLSFTCNLSKGLLLKSGLNHNNYFAGHACALKLKKHNFIDMLSGIKNGLTELGCHPGTSLEEKNALSNKDFHSKIKSNSIELISY